MPPINRFCNGNRIGGRPAAGCVALTSDRRCWRDRATSSLQLSYPRVGCSGGIGNLGSLFESEVVVVTTSLAGIFQTAFAARPIISRFILWTVPDPHPTILATFRMP